MRVYVGYTEFSEKNNEIEPLPLAIQVNYYYFQLTL